MGHANRIVAQTLKLVADACKPGVTTKALDKIAEDYCRKEDSIPAFKGYRGFPGSLCVSINEQVVHGIPSKKVVLREGDIISIDFGVNYKGFFGDAAITVPVGKIAPEDKRLLDVTQESLAKGIEQALVGNRVSDISKAVQRCAESAGYSVVRQFVGHGIGRDLHEAPEVPNYYRKGRSPRLQPGMVLAIEPMVNMGTDEVRVLRDGWTVETADRKHSAHFEHSVVICEDGPRILSVCDKQ